MTLFLNSLSQQITAILVTSGLLSLSLATTSFAASDPDDIEVTTPPKELVNGHMEYDAVELKRLGQSFVDMHNYRNTPFELKHAKVAKEPMTIELEYTELQQTCSLPDYEDIAEPAGRDNCKILVGELGDGVIFRHIFKNKEGKVLHTFTIDPAYCAREAAEN